MTIAPSSLTPKDAQITAGQIAELAGVGRAAVSNWRRRFKDFPSPIAVAPGGGDLFRYGDVEGWLQKHDRLRAPLETDEELWQVFDTTRNDLPFDRTVELGCAFLGLLAVDRSRSTWNRLLQRINAGETAEEIGELREKVVSRKPDLADLFTPLERLEPETTPVLTAFLLLSDTQPPEKIFEEVLRRRDRLRVYGATESVSTSVLTEIITRIAEPAGTVFDPAVGEGGFLLAAAARRGQPSLGSLRLTGQEINERTRRIARLRFLVHGLKAEIYGGDSLLADAVPDLRADVVVCDPPFGSRWNQPPSSRDPRWFAGAPGESSQEMAWVQHVIHHLTPNGRGYLTLPTSSLFRQSRDGDIRRELVRRGCIEAIVSLPRGLFESTTVPASIWVVRRPSSEAAGLPVLLINDGAHAFPTETEMAAGSIDKVVSRLARFRKDPVGFKQDPGFAAAVKPLDLLARDATLVPAHWVKQTVSAAEAKKAIQEAEAALALDGEIVINSLPPPGLNVDLVATERPMVKVRDLAEVVRGLPIKKYLANKGLPVLQSPWSRRSEQRQFVNPGLIKNKRATTQPGDVVVMTVGSKPRAFVDKEGGNVLPDFMQALRLKGGTDPVVLAALLSAPLNGRYIAGSVIPRLNLIEVEVPTLTASETRILRKLLDSWSEAELAASALAESAATLREVVLDGIVSGALAISEATQ